MTPENQEFDSFAKYWEGQAQMAPDEHQRHFAEQMMKACQAASDATRLSLPSAVRSPNWIPVTERLPDVPLGEEELFWVCAHRKHNGKRYVFTLHYVNKPHLDPRTNEPADWALESEFDDTLDAVGWHEIGPSETYDEYYRAVADVDEIIAWMPMEKPAAPGEPVRIASTVAASTEPGLVRDLRNMASAGWALRYEHDGTLAEAANTIERLEQRVNQLEASRNALSSPSSSIAASSEVMTTLKAVEDAIFQCTGTALLAGEKCKPSDPQVIYRILCEAGNRVAWVRDELSKPASAIAAPEPRRLYCSCGSVSWLLADGTQYCGDPWAPGGPLHRADSAISQEQS